MTTEMKQLLEDLISVFEKHNARIDVQDGEALVYLRCKGWVSLFVNAEYEGCDLINADTLKRLLKNGAETK
jgi:hypothetical protein